MNSSQSKPYHRPFCLSVKGHVKILRLAVTVTSMTLFIVAQAPEPYIVIAGCEATIIFFFIIMYVFRIDKFMKWLFWPLLDIINSMVSTLFMIIISALALIPESTTMIMLGGVFGFLAAACAVADCTLMYRKVLFNPSGPYQKKDIHDQSEHF